MKKLVIASNNTGKLKEIQNILGKYYEVVPMSQLGFTKEIEETGKTFFENALIKAKTVAKAFKKCYLCKKNKQNPQNQQKH